MTEEEQTIEDTFKTLEYLKNEKRFQEAEEILKQALEIFPDNQSLKDWEYILLAETKPNDALKILKQKLKTEPRNPYTYNNLATIYSTLGNKSKAVAYAEKCVKLGDHPQFYNNLGFQYKNLYRFDDALNAFKMAKELGSDHPGILTNLGNMYGFTRQYDKALEVYEEALKINPNEAGTLVNIGLINMIQGDLEKGWEYLEHRTRFYGQLVDYIKFFGEKKLWKGEDLTNKKLYLFAEQGIGDSIQFVRYIPYLKQKYKNLQIDFNCTYSIAELYKRNFPNINILVKEKTDPHKLEFDYHLPLMSLPHRLKIPVPNQPYLKANGKLDLPKGHKIAIGWKGNPRHPDDYFRSAKLEYFLPLKKYATLYSLLIDYDGEEIEKVPLNTFEDSATLINSVDMVISVDSAPIHLAGAMGKPVWMLVSYLADYRWGHVKDTSVWYPNLRIFRQKKPGDWQSAMNEILHEFNI